jgi:ubiquinone/menaquinone biosynthesis C-methylase UbiE
VSTKLAQNTPFDQYSRQKAVAEVLDGLRGKNGFTVLDVGGYKGKTQDFLAADTVTVVDVVDVHEKNYVKASGLALPFEPGSFDFTVSFDVLEHIKEKDRETFLQECLRTAKRGVFICAPQRTGANSLAERELNRLYKEIRGVDHRWLEEHIENGLPNFVALEKLVKKAGYYTLSVYSNSSELWTLMQGALFTNEQYAGAAEHLVTLNGFYNQQFGSDIHASDQTAYRRIMMIFKDKADYEKVSRQIDTKHRQYEEQRIEVVMRVLNFYIKLLENFDAQNKQLATELKNTQHELEAITSSKSWRYARKLADIKSKARMGRR